jgi:hypothetical protein
VALDADRHERVRTCDQAATLAPGTLRVRVLSANAISSTRAISARIEPRRCSISSRYPFRPACARASACRIRSPSR